MADIMKGKKDKVDKMIKSISVKKSKYRPKTFSLHSKTEKWNRTEKAKKGCFKDLVTMKQKFHGPLPELFETVLVTTV